jgi:hypothetical protein
VFDRHQGGATPFAKADGLDEPQDDQKDRCPDSDLLVSRQAPDDECSQRHDHHRDHQLDLAADPIAEMTEDSTADRTRDETYRIGWQRSQGTRQGIDVWKKTGC